MAQQCRAQSQSASAAPMARAPDPSTADQHPIARYPNGPGVGRMNVAAGEPDVAVAIPAPIAGLPDPIGTWTGRRRRRYGFGLRRWRRSYLCDCRCGHADEKRQCRQRSNGNKFRRTPHDRISTGEEVLVIIRSRSGFPFPNPGAAHPRKRVTRRFISASPAEAFPSNRVAF